jgi:PAS domain S-box-containing protein
MADIVIKDSDEEVDSLAEYEQLFQTVFEMSDEGIMVIEPDPNGRVLEANPAAAEMHGYKVEEMTKLRVSDLHSAQATEDAGRAIARMLEGEWVENDHEHLRKGGARFPVRYRAGSVYYRGRRVIMAFHRDITAEKQTEEELHQCESELGE